MDLRQTAMRIALKTGFLTKCEFCGELSTQPEKVVDAQRYAFLVSIAEGLIADKKPLQRAIASLPDDFQCECHAGMRFEGAVLAGSIGCY